MAYEGELTRMADGRWARFRRLSVINPGTESPVILVAVELDEQHQALLAAAEDSLETYSARGIPFRVELDQDPEGHEEVRLAASFASLQP